MHTLYKKSPTTFRGFTLVELLIVIVIIAILASITLVSYGNITKQARNSAIESAANAYVKALTLYKVEYGGYPASPAIMNTPAGTYGWRMVCLGLPSDYPKTDIYQEGQCANGYDGLNLNQGDIMYSSLLAQELQTEISPLPSTKEARVDPERNIRGFLYQAWLWGNQDPNQTVTDGENSPSISFFVHTPKYTCPQGWVSSANYGGSYQTRCTISLP